MRHFCNQNLMKSKAEEERRRAELLAQVPGQGARIVKALTMAVKIEAFAAVHA